MNIKIPELGLGKKLQGKAKNRIGLDIGTAAIKIIEATDSPDKPALISLGIKRIAGAAKSAIPDLIKAAAAESKVSSRDANISISGSSVIVRFITMPKMSYDELKSAIKFEAEKFIPFNMADCTIDFQILKKDPRENKLDILLVAAKRGYIEERVRMAEDGGFSVKTVDVDSFAVTNSFLKNFAAANVEKSSAVLNIGASLTNLTVMKENMICLVRDVGIGMNDFNAAVAKSLNLPVEAVEDPAGLSKEKMPDAANAAKSVFNNLFDEIRLSFSYYENQNGRGVDTIYVSGGGTGLAGIKESFKEAFGSEPVFWNPLEFMDCTSPEIDANLLSGARHLFAVAAGLVLR